VSPARRVTGDAVKISNAPKGATEYIRGGGADAGGGRLAVYTALRYTDRDVGRDALNAEEIGLPFKLARQPAECEEPEGKQDSQTDELQEGRVSDPSHALEQNERAAGKVHGHQGEDSEEWQMPVVNVAGFMPEDGFNFLVVEILQERVGHEDVSHRRDEPHHGGVDRRAVRLPEKNLPVTQADASAGVDKASAQRAVGQAARGPDPANEHGRAEQDKK